MKDFIERDQRCVDCGSNRVVEVILNGSVHYSRIECAQCRRFITWGKKPSTVAHTAKLAERIDALRILDAPDGWEREFVQSVADQFRRKGKLSPKQTD